MEEIGTRQRIANAMMEYSPMQAHRLGVPGQIAGLMGSLSMVPTAEQEALEAPLFGPETYGVQGLGRQAGGALGIMAGRGAKTADLGKLARAEGMAAQQATGEDIFAKTGWYQGMDGKWRFEIPDRAATLNANLPRSASRPEDIDTPMFERLFDPDGRFSNQPGRTLADTINHAEFVKAYPQLGATPVRSTGSDFRSSGSFGESGVRLRQGTPGAVRSTLLHELQHAVQKEEGFAQGGSPSQFFPEGKAAAEAFTRVSMSDIEKRWRVTHPKLNALSLSAGLSAKARGGTPLKYEQDALDMVAGDPELARFSRLFADADRFRKIDSDAFKSYKNLAGEAEARLVQTRRDMLPADAAKTYPPTQFDVPLKDQIVARQDAVAAAMLERAHGPR